LGYSPASTDPAAEAAQPSTNCAEEEGAEESMSRSDVFGASDDMGGSVGEVTSGFGGKEVWTNNNCDHNG